MGMSASQARLLSITSRMNDVEFKSQQIANTKIRLADESEQIANDYTRALNKQKFTYTDFSSGTAVKVDLNINNMINSGYTLKSRSGQTVMTKAQKYVFDATIQGYNGAIGASWNPNGEAGCMNNAKAVYALRTLFNVGSFSEAKTKYGLTDDNNIWQQISEASGRSMSEINAAQTTGENLLNTATTKDSSGKMSANVIVIDNVSPSQLYEMIESGQFYLEKGGKEVSVAGDNQLAIENDTTDMAKAEAEYNAKTAKINRKEKLLDNDLKALDTEHSALSTEFDSVKTLIGDNVEKSFNLFS